MKQKATICHSFMYLSVSNNPKKGLDLHHSNFAPNC